MQAEARFKTGARLLLLSIVAFGSHGLNDDWTAYANMPAFYGKYSRAEIERVVDYIRTLKGTSRAMRSAPSRCGCYRRDVSICITQKLRRDCEPPGTSDAYHLLSEDEWS